MKRTLCLVATLSIVLSACSTSAPDDSTPNDSTHDGTTHDDTTPTVTPDDSTPEDAAAISCDQFSIDLDPAMASGYTCHYEPAFFDDLGNSEAIRIDLEGYPLTLTDSYLGYGGIWVYPVESLNAFMAVSWPNEDIPGQVSELQALIGNSPPPDQSVQLPYVENGESTEFFHAQYKVIPFENGNGIRYLTGFSQGERYLSNWSLYFAFEALTDDGQYWVEVVLPINTPVADDDLGYPSDGSEADLLAYVTHAVDVLNSQPSDSFTPSIDALDALVSSITIAP